MDMHNHTQPHTRIHTIVLCAVLADALLLRSCRLVAFRNATPLMVAAACRFRRACVQHLTSGACSPLLRRRLVYPSSEGGGGDVASVAASAFDVARTLHYPLSLPKDEPIQKVCVGVRGCAWVCVGGRGCARARGWAWVGVRDDSRTKLVISVSRVPQAHTLTYSHTHILFWYLNPA